MVKVFIVLLVSALAVGGGVIYFNDISHRPALNPANAIAPSPTVTSLPTSTEHTVIIPGWKTYTHRKYGFSFDYPPNYSSTQYSDQDEFVLLMNGAKRIHIDFKSPNADRSNSNDQSFLGFAARVAMMQCEASGPGNGSGTYQYGSQEYCDNVVQKIPLQNPYGLTGYRLYLHWVSQALPGPDPVSPWKTVKEATVGPVLAYDVSKQTHYVLRDIQIFSSPLGNQASRIEPSILDSIGSSIRFTRTP